MNDENTWQLGYFKIHIITQNSWQLKIIFWSDYTLYINLKCNK